MTTTIEQNAISLIAPVIAGANAVIANSDWKISKDLKKDGLGTQVSLSDGDIYYLLMDSVKTKLAKKKESTNVK